MRLLLLLTLAALVAVAMAGARCKGVKEGAIKLAGMGYYNGKYFRTFGGIAGSKRKQKLVGFFKIWSKEYKGFGYAYFDFKNKVAYAAKGTSKEDAKCYKVSIKNAKYFKMLCPKSWPNARVVAKSTITSKRVPVAVVCSKFKCKKTGGKVSLSGIFDKKCVPFIIKKRYSSEGKNFGGALIFGDFHRPRGKYFKLPKICRNATEAPGKREAGQVLEAPKGAMKPL